MAAAAKPCPFNSSMAELGQGSPPKTAQEMRNTAPMLTRAERRCSGSQQVGESSTASMPSAAAERNSAPTLVGSTMPSSTATRRAVERIRSAGTGAGRRKAHRIPRVSS